MTAERVASFKTLYGEDAQGNLYVLHAENELYVRREEPIRDPIQDIFQPVSYLLTGNIERYTVLKQKGSYLEQAIVEKMQDQIKELEASVDYIKGMRR